MKAFTRVNWNNMNKEYKDLIWVTNGRCNKRILKKDLETYKANGFLETWFLPKEPKTQKGSRV